MMSDQVENFIDGLIKKTKEDNLEWKPFRVCSIRKEVIQELENGRGNIDFVMNSIREGASYFLKSGEGYVFLFEIYHGDPDVTSPDMDTLGLMVKINDTLPLENLSEFNHEEQENLEILRMNIEHVLEEKYSYPDALYKFMADVLGEKN
ncbi:hypothetical protein [Eisenbergiella porci]|uniref:hypothetical protein n=1 Tax=Eisenbergiella porci TaxID=2652274 RepID=UPI002A840917|nr:hypothetical protein [Eisenbergiella porci]